MADQPDSPPNDSLTKYRQKRDFKKTREPQGVLAKTTGQRYLIQKHAATRLHYDFRLELDGVLKSWAVTRGPSLNPADKRLAVEVEDHPVAYGAFEGTIPKGQYGGGTVMLWDEGTWEPIGDPHEGLKNGDLKFILHGQRLKGSWVLARMKPRPQDRGRHNWLLIKHREGHDYDSDGEAWLADHATSIASGRSMEAIAADPGKVWTSGGAHKAKKSVAKRKPKTLAPLKFRKPELATLADAMPTGDDWVHEVKFDGYRTLALIDQGQVRLMTRSGLDWTDKYRAIADRLKALDADQALLDGEIVALNQAGASSFAQLKDELSAGRSDHLQYYVFDLLSLNGEDLTRLPLLERKARLKTLLAAQDFDNRINYSEHFSGDADVLPRICDLHMEGIISKRADSPYHGGRGKAWLKVKCHKRQEFVIIGFLESEHAGRGFRSLLLGYYEDGALCFAGKVGTGFNQDSLQDIRSALDQLKPAKAPMKDLPPDVRAAKWVAPQLVCEVEFTEWTGDGRLRHPSFQGLREDKKAREVGRDREEDVDKATAEAEAEIARKTPEKPAKPAQKTHREEAFVAGIRISHPDRVVYPGGETKLDIASYYHNVSKHILPHLIGRPLSVLRAPETIDQVFFQRHLPDRGGLHDVTSIKVPVKTHSESYMMIENEAGLLSLAQWGVIELHPWGCHADDPLLPDRLIFDLDPDPEAPWQNVIDGASDIRERMRELGLDSFLKTTGGKGLHVVVPIRRQFHWPAIKAFARAVAESMAHDDPKRYIAKMSKAARKGLVFIDYLRNDLTATAVSAFSVRARPGACVSMPLSWSELKPSLNPAAFTIHTVPERLATQKADPWAGFFDMDQALRADILTALKIDAQ